ncbi:MAG: ATP phosphoribosyltransferase regulatory subunit [Alphaproteobacteria bacterium GM202ARS2]|nr:ATP phosphoribosyltransferase regulatory subunit [Alphaproteobacteria bacterium GM202ARS2]
MMMATKKEGILPSGFRDVLPPQADYEAAVVARLMKHFQSAGYARVKPSLMEFETHHAVQTTGAAGGSDDNRLKLMDPVSNHLMLIRNDFTTQVARIARTSLAHHPRPLRLSYQGEALCAHGSVLNPARQYGQVGIERFGNDDANADIEVMILALEGLHALSIPEMTLDLNMPPLTQALFEHFEIAPDVAVPLRHALNSKDKTAIAQLSGKGAPTFQQLIEAAGDAEVSVTRLQSLSLPLPAKRPLEQFIETAERIIKSIKHASVVLDPLENHGFAYHSGVTFSYLTRVQGRELGRGGQYNASATTSSVQRLPTGTRRTSRAPQRLRSAGALDAEPAVGCSLFVDTLVDSCPLPIEKVL